MVQGKGKYTVITGASSGIGYETAKAFAAVCRFRRQAGRPDKGNYLEE